MIRLFGARLSAAEPLEGGERGVIVNTASVAAYDGQIGQAAYSASKGGVVGMTLADRARIRAVRHPDQHDRAGHLLHADDASLPPAAQESLGRSVPFPARLGDPPEYAALAVHLVENGYINGETIRIDGSIRLAPK